MLKSLLCNRADEGERGVVVIWMALMMVVLLGMAALVLDLGYARETKRQVQNAGDAAALGAAQALPNLTSTEAQAKSLTATNLSGAASDWASCQDATPLAVTSATRCISFDSSFTQVRVRVPDDVLPTWFAKVLGVDSVSVHAAAVAQIVSAGLGTIQPFAMYSGAGVEACLKTGGQTPDPICNNTTGNFGTLDISMYGNANLGTITRCGNSQQAARLSNNTAIGIDHVITAYAGTEVRDGCGNAGPNTLQTRTGNAQSEFDTGILHGSGSSFDDGQPARLQRGNGPKATAAGVSIDNVPLWQFIPSGALPGAPASCRRSVFDSLIATNPVANQKTALHSALGQCFADYRAGVGCGGSCTGSVFAANTSSENPLDLFDLQLSPRFVYVPKFAESSGPNGAKYLHVVGFQPVFLQRLYGGCSANRCSTDSEPGPWNSASNGQGNDKADAVTAFVIDPRMLPAGLDKPFAIGKTAFVQLAL